jgi:hypothetical protein
MKKFILISILMLFTINCKSLYSDTISVTQGKYSDYYHIKYKLKKKNFLLPKKANDPAYNGQFEILLKKQNFPIPAKNCKGNLILRMPSNFDDTESEKKAIKEKVTLYNEIMKVYNDNKKSIDIIIELNPYVSVVSKNPIKLELNNCNIFFRAKGDRYINHL